MGYYDMGQIDDGLSDDELLLAFESGALTGSDFPHESHVRVTWLLVQRDGREAAYDTVAAGIRDIARRAGRPGVFHETITRAWFELIAAAPTLGAHPELFDRGLLRGYYSAEALACGRRHWVEPDIAPFEL
jgi:hypothetical protein